MNDISSLRVKLGSWVGWQTSPTGN